MKATLTKPTADVKVDPRFEELQFDVRQALSAAGGSTADWEKIVKTSRDLLAQSQDFLVAGYLSVGLSQLHKVEGLIEGVRGYLDVIEKHWETATPPVDKPNARVRAIGWWSERSATSLRAFAHLPFPREAALDLLERSRNADRILGTQLHDAPSFASLIQSFDRLTQEAEAIPAPLASSAPQKAVVAESEISTESDVKSAQDRLVSGSRRLSSYRQSAEASDPRAYRLNRFSYWFFINEVPASENGKTRIPAPSAQLITRLASLRSEKQWAALVQFAEDTASQSIFWLDLQRACAEALERMGDPFVNAADAVRREASAFVARLAGVESLTFADGTPFADDETKVWLQPQTQGASAVVPSITDLEKTIEKDIEELKPVLKARKYSDAAARFQERLRNSKSVHEQFLYRLSFAALVSKVGGTAWFAPQAEQILTDINVYRLEQFDPALALKGITVAMKGYRAQSDAASKKRAEELLQRLAQLDLMEFVRQGGAH